MNEDKFNYSYTAPTENERREIESIKKQYEPASADCDKLERLKKLNRRVTLPPLIAGIVTGIAGVLILGTGMTMVLEWGATLWGIIVGIVGVAVAAAGYPVYKLWLNKNKKKYGGEIIKLADELLNNN